MLGHAPIAMLIVNSHGEIQNLNSAAEKLLGYAKEELIGKAVEMLVPAGTKQSHIEYRDNFLKSPTVRPVGNGRNLSALHKDGRLIRVEIALNPIVIGSDDPVVIVSVLDQTMHDRAERAELFVSELRHRAKNMFAVISAISHQIGAHSLSQADFQSAFDERLQSFAASYDLLARENWQAPTIVDLVRSQLTFVEQKNMSAIAMDGPNIRLSAKYAEYLGLAIHELATNALKHGALSVPSGRLQIHWAADEAAKQFQFDWQEFDGPPVTPPQRKGFGRIVLESVVPATFEGEAELLTPPSGVSWHLKAPLTTIMSSE